MPQKVLLNEDYASKYVEKQPPLLIPMISWSTNHHGREQFAPYGDLHSAAGCKRTPKYLRAADMHDVSIKKI
jgi:hypothetical protein